MSYLTRINTLFATISFINSIINLLGNEGNHLFQLMAFLQLYIKTYPYDMQMVTSLAQSKVPKFNSHSDRKIQVLSL